MGWVMLTVAQRHRTAMERVALSRPLALALADGLLDTEATIFDYGCGRGGDVQRLSALGYRIDGWDPVFRPDVAPAPADVVNFGYVANVIEDPGERVGALRAAWALAGRLLIVAARVDWEARGVAGRPFGDGILTGRGTFQKFYEQEELRAWIDGSLGVRAVAAAPGIFYVFRDSANAQGYMAARVRRRPRAATPVASYEAIYEANRTLLQPLEEFMLSRGRAPEAIELPASAAIVERLGSLRRAVELIRRVVGDPAWEAAREAAREDLVVYLALAAFGGRPRFSELPPDLQLDIRAAFGPYRDACAAADVALFAAGNQPAVDLACREATIGKLTPEALYVHVSALDRLAPLLRIYEGCGRALTGAVEGVTVLKLHRAEPKVSYLAYPDFDTDPHPALATSVRADLRRLDVKFSDFRSSANPPILHRKETLVAEDYPRRVAFACLTAQEERAGLYAEPATIGTRVGWERALAAAGKSLRGHRLVRADVGRAP
jgi:DNA phosphorothioation-associated putative methyltransferase